MILALLSTYLIVSFVACAKILLVKATKKQLEYLHSLKNLTKTNYTKIGSVYCPILDQNIVFNSIGFRHLTIKPDGTYRNAKEAIYKLKLFPLAIPTIKNATAVIEERETTFVVGRGHRKKYKRATSYALAAYVGRKKPVMVRIIIIKVGDGNYNFYSIMKH